MWFKLDLKNAYNSQPRRAALESLGTAASGLTSFLRIFYSRPSRYIYRTSKDSYTVIQAVEGVEQGDAAGPALFAAGLRAPLDALRSSLHAVVNAAHDPVDPSSPPASPVFVFAYLDDTIIGVPPTYAVQAFDSARAQFASAGHVVHPGTEQDKTGC